MVGRVEAMRRVGAREAFERHKEVGEVGVVVVRWVGV